MPATETAAEDKVIRPFAATLREIGAGKAHDRLSEQLHDLIAGITETGKKGSLEIKLTVEPVSKGDVSTLLFVLSSTPKIPQGADSQPRSVFFVDKAGNPTRNDPTYEQGQLPMRVVGDTREAATA